MSIRNRVIATFGVILLPLAGTAAGVAHAQTGQYPPASESVTVSRTEVPAGGTVEVSGRAAPNSTVTFSLPAQVLGTALTNNTGAFRAAVTIPCEVRGAQILRTTGPGIDASTPLNIVGSTEVCVADAADDDNLPVTGSSSTAPLTAAGVGLLLIGAATAITARRRRRAESA